MLNTEHQCSIPDCGRAFRAKGYCSMHLRRFNKYGDALAGGRFANKYATRHAFFAQRCLTCDGEVEQTEMGWRGRVPRKYCSDQCRNAGAALARPDKTPSEVRFWANVERRGPDDCWPWLAFTHKGYGRMRNGDRSMGAHRFSYELHHGAIAPGLTVLHDCDNPCCVNPAHLSAGTNQDNNRDRDQKGRNARGERHASAILNEQQVLTVREMARMGSPRKDIADRFCVSKECIRAIITGRTWKHLPG